MIWTYFPDQTTAMNALMAGEIDFFLRRQQWRETDLAQVEPGRVEVFMAAASRKESGDRQGAAAAEGEIKELLDGCVAIRQRGLSPAALGTERRRAAARPAVVWEQDEGPQKSK